MKKVTIETVIGVNDNIPESEIGDILQPLIEKISNMVMSEEGMECIGFQAYPTKGTSGNFLGSRIRFIESKDVNKSIKMDMLLEDSDYYIIRIPVEGDESHKTRFDLMDDVIEKAGYSPEEEKSNVFFVFDSGNKEDFEEIARSLLFSVDETTKNYASSQGISFCQWISRKDRSVLVEDIPGMV